MTGKRNTAINAAAREAGVAVTDMRDTKVLQKDGLIEVRFITDWMIYDCYMEQGTMEVLGFDYIPVPPDLQIVNLRESARSAS